MYCNHCGAANAEGSKFCNKCGNQIHIAITPVERTERPEFYSALDKLMTDPFDRGENTSSSAEEKPEEVTATQPTAVETVKEEKEIEVKEESVPETEASESKITIISRPQEDDSPLSKLSTYHKVSQVNEEKRYASAVLDPIEDEYWDEPKKEIEEEIYSIPKENFLKIFGSIVALILVIFWFIYML